ncbi:2-hydroxyacylsphingosine 1-beta-galactosyltransferase [Blattella germanica]|nr:2-hydroxyacylsphingosine 1-beta-galactosyltransferase [Blattella germanica]
MLWCTQGARILGLFPFPARSHKAIFSPLLRELATRGHDVVIYSPYPEIPPVANITDVVMAELDYRDHKRKESLYTLKDQGMMGKLVVLWKMGLHTCEKVLQDKEVQGILQSTEIHFDLILIEAFFNECLLGFAHKFRAPTVHICSHGGMFWMGDYVGNPNPHAYVPDVFFDFSDKMTFQQRVWNTLAALFARAGRELWYLPQQNTIMKNYFKYEDLPSVWELQTNTSAVMLNTHVAVNYPRPLMPNLLLVGGMHIKKPGKLPQDLQRYLDDAPGGVIYFSMGTNLQSSLMPESKVKAFLGAFSRLTEQKVLWKWESDSLPGQPNNVKLAKWLPQSDILAHPNIRLFVSHGGMMSTQEAVYRGVPLVGIPIFSDQLLNIRQASAAGYALHLDYENITEESVYWAIQQVLYVPK